MTEIWNHHQGFAEARRRVEAQTMEQDLDTIDALLGRDELAFGATPAEVKAEALRQIEIDFRSDRNETAEFWTNVARARRPGA
jgi:hypothetical protein